MAVLPAADVHQACPSTTTAHTTMATANKASPPKPWERAGAGAQSSLPSVTSAAAPSTSSNASSTSSVPALPAKPANMVNSDAATSSNALTSGTSAYNNNASYANRYGATGYGTGYGNTYGSSYASPYSRFGGGYGGGFGGGYGGYSGFGGGGFGSYGSPYGYGGPGGPNDMSLTRQMEAGTQATFQLLQSVVSAFGGFAQMLESTYMATHSSFFAMIGVAEQFTNLRNWLGEVLSVFTLLRFVKRILGWGGANTDAASAVANGSNGISSADFNAFSATGRTTPVQQTGAAAGAGAAKPKASKKPIVIFFLTVIGLPWLMNKLVKLITAKQQAEARRLGLPEGAIPPLFDHTGQPLPQHMQPPGVDLNLLANTPHATAQMQQQQRDAAIDPATLTFVRAQYEHQSVDEFELSFKQNDIIAVLTPKEERTEPGWWRGRLRDGRIGWFPSTHVQEIPMNTAQKKLEAAQDLSDHGNNLKKDLKA